MNTKHCIVLCVPTLPNTTRLDDAELTVRKIVQHYVLIAANSGLRVGEQRQLRWSDVQIEQHKVNGEEQKLARIHVRAETSKVRTSRTFLCRNGQYFERLREISKPKIADELVFTIGWRKPNHASVRCYTTGTR